MSFSYRFIFNSFLIPLIACLGIWSNGAILYTLLWKQRNSGNSRQQEQNQQSNIPFKMKIWMTGLAFADLGYLVKQFSSTNSYFFIKHIYLARKFESV
jgi:hypothetical protein